MSGHTLRIIVMAMALYGAVDLHAKPRLYIYHPSLMKPHVIQDMLARKCPRLEITVFGRQTDFHAKVIQEKPEAVMATSPVLESFGQYGIRLRGMRNGSSSEPFVLVSLNTPLERKSLPNSSVGVVGILERREMQKLVESMTGTSSRVNRVTKVEDLLPLLLFRSADAILISLDTYAEFQKKSQAKLAVLELKQARMGLVSLALRSDTESPIVMESVKKLEADENALLGVDSWR